MVKDDLVYVTNCLLPSSERAALVARFLSMIFGHQDNVQSSEQPVIEDCIPKPIQAKQEVKQEPPTPPPAIVCGNKDSGNNHAQESLEDATVQKSDAPPEQDADSESVDILRVLDAEKKAKESIIVVTLDEDEGTPTPAIGPAENETPSTSPKRKVSTTVSSECLE